LPPPFASLPPHETLLKQVRVVEVGTADQFNGMVTPLSHAADGRNTHGEKNEPLGPALPHPSPLKREPFHPEDSLFLSSWNRDPVPASAGSTASSFHRLSKHSSTPIRNDSSEGGENLEWKKKRHPSLRPFRPLRRAGREVPGIAEAAQKRRGSVKPRVEHTPRERERLR